MGKRNIKMIYQYDGSKFCGFQRQKKVKTVQGEIERAVFKTFNQEIAKKLTKEKEITIIAGHYEGIDERVVENKVDMELSIGDFVLTGGEIPAMAISDTIIRLLPDVIKKESYENDSFYNGLLDYPHYTRPAEYKDLKVPEVLLSGNHKKIDEWRLKESLRRTYLRRRELIENRELTKLEKKLLDEIKKEEV